MWEKALIVDKNEDRQASGVIGYPDNSVATRNYSYIESVTLKSKNS